MPTDPGRLRAIAAAHQHLPGGLLPALHAVQDELGHVPDAAVPILAEAFNRSRAEVHGVLTYYHHFRRQPPGRHVLQVCRAEACQACGAEALYAQAGQRLGCSADRAGAIGDGLTSADGAVTLQSVYCLGLCASSPAMQLDERLLGRVTADRLDSLLATLGAGQ